jgi:hypothetical protein
LDKRSATDEVAVRYLLGEMTEEEKTRLERDVLRDEGAFEEVAAAEDELIDDYLSGSLSAEERDRFEKLYAVSPERRERVAFARALHRRLGQEARSSAVVPLLSRRRRTSAALLAAAAILFAVLGAYFAWSSVLLRRELRRVESEKSLIVRREQDLARRVVEVQGRADQLQTQLERQHSETALLSDQLASLRSRAANVVSFVLTTGLVRGNGTLQTLRIPRGADAARLTLPVSDGHYASYSAVIQTPEGGKIWQGKASLLEPAAKSVSVTVPTGNLPSGDYILSLTGFTAVGRPEPVADYSFRVNRS